MQVPWTSRSVPFLAFKQWSTWLHAQHPAGSTGCKGCHSVSCFRLPFRSQQLRRTGHRMHKGHLSGGQNPYPVSLTVRNLLTVAYETQGLVDGARFPDKRLRRLRWQRGKPQLRAYGGLRHNTRNDFAYGSLRNPHVCLRQAPYHHSLKGSPLQDFPFSLAVPKLGGPQCRPQNTIMLITSRNKDPCPNHIPAAPGDVARSQREASSARWSASAEA